MHGKYDGSIEMKTEDGNEFLVVDGVAVRVFHEKDPASIPWGEAGADILCESTGVFLESAKAEAHLKGGCKKIIMSAPPKVGRVSGEKFVRSYGAACADPLGLSCRAGRRCSTRARRCNLIVAKELILIYIVLSPG